MIKIFIADDRAVVRKGLREIVSDTDDISVTGEACSAQEAPAKISENTYDV